MNSILIAVAVVGGIGLILGIGLGIASIVFRVKVNETEQKLLEILPGANCGACSFAGCAEYAKALATGNVKTTLCPVGGREGVEKISAILGVEAAGTRKKVAFVQCRGNGSNTKKALDYEGVRTCYAERLLCSGDGACVYGCNGLGDCTAVCQNNAITIVDGVAKVDCAKCVGCGLCIAACPKKLITLVCAGDSATVACRNRDKGGETRKACVAGCIGCGKCAGACPSKAITVADNLATIDTEKCTGCGTCVATCPVKAITF